MEDFMKMAVGKIFPGPIPQQEGGFFEVQGGQATLYIQFPGLNKEEKNAFKKGVISYSYVEFGEHAPVAYWIFNFRKPMNTIETSFNARIVATDSLNPYLELEQGLKKNALTILLLDGQTLQGIRLLGLEHEAMDLFHATIHRQLSLQFSSADFALTLQQLMQYSAKEIANFGTTFEIK